MRTQSPEVYTCGMTLASIKLKQTNKQEKLKCKSLFSAVLFECDVKCHISGNEYYSLHYMSTVGILTCIEVCPINRDKVITWFHYPFKDSLLIYSREGFALHITVLLKKYF